MAVDSGERATDDTEATDAGRISRPGGRHRPTERSQIDAIFRKALGSQFAVAPERFRELWAHLEALGVFELPRWRGGIPPEDRQSVLLASGGRTWIFLRPVDAVGEVGGLPQEEINRLNAIWGKVKLTITHFH